MEQNKPLEDDKLERVAKALGVSKKAIENLARKNLQQDLKGLRRNYH
ncbi:hypothetical protein RM553_05200 [Zunongwangia sp. F363]|uniref:Uncharacterized protein n=1 Tax=Autumnicola tepida TaxID=3075595 RepID=A0ABU3C7A5_9FLAO|nr:hypothetical protein [Zunongwangia sp. F363]MDT0642225.1 hypothetical protein [Zunongwangia sp. F363]